MLQSKGKRFASKKKVESKTLRIKTLTMETLHSHFSKHDRVSKNFFINPGSELGIRYNFKTKHAWEYALWVGFEPTVNIQPDTV